MTARIEARSLESEEEADALKRFHDRMDELCLSDEEVRQMEEAEMARRIKQDMDTMHLPPDAFPGLREAPLG